MKTISSELSEHLNEPLTYLTLCWKVTRTDEVVMGFTSHDEDIIFDGVTYLAKSGFIPSDVENTNGLKSDNLAIEGILSDNAIIESDILAGLYDFALVELFAVNYTDLSQGRILLKTGSLADVQISGNRFTVDVKGITERFSQNIGQIYSPLCRAKLGDSKCKIAMSPNYQFNATVTALESQRVFSSSALTQDKGFFDFGKLTFTSGLNQNISQEIRRFEAGTIELMLPMPFLIGLSDAFVIEAGCDKTFHTCKNRFNNAINFRG
ncbi:MAG: DUF2163 domain-containing protein, partial [Rickettsiales bacterium]|nr:DUF2163 domain-containing protein [Rickettsiales bacterium]